MNKPKPPASALQLKEALADMERTVASLRETQQQTAEVHHLFLRGQQIALGTVGGLISGDRELSLPADGASSPVIAPAHGAPPAPQEVTPPRKPEATSDSGPAGISSWVGATAPAATTDFPRSEADVIEALLDIVSKSTGYPVDVLDPNMDLESDLGIDFIKRVQILSLFTGRVPGGWTMEPEQLGRFRTLKEVAEFAVGWLPAPTETGGTRIVIDPATHLYLADHQLSGKPVVPLAMILEWFLAAAPQPPHQVVVEDLRIFQGLVVGDDVVHVQVLLRDSAAGGVASELRDSFGKLRAQATIRINIGGHGEISALNLGELTPYPLKPEQAYSKRLFHGPRFRAIVEIEGASAQGMAALLRVGTRVGDWILGPSLDWRANPLAIDGCFQMMCLWCWEYKGSPCLPSAIRRFAQFQTSWPNTVRVHVAVRREAGSNVEFDVLVSDLSGPIIAVLEGVRCTYSPSLVSAFGR